MLTDLVRIVRYVIAREDVVDVSAWTPEDDETLGARDKSWLRESAEADAAWWLFKRPRARGLPELGADLWAEVLASRIARLIQVPAANARFAVWGADPGVISGRVGAGLVHGNELLAARDPDYPTDKTAHVLGYDLDAVAAALDGYTGSEPDLTAFESFSGYLVFDAVIGNTDRHHENWAVLADSGALAPSYDHGASLGFNASPAQRRDPVEYARRATSRHFPDRIGLVDLARAALAKVPGKTADLWLSRVDALSMDDVRGTVAAVPDGWMSEEARTFVVRLVAANRGRLTR